MGKITNQKVIELAKTRGFNLVGFAKTEKLTNEITHLKEWLSKNYQAEMSYMERNLDKRENPELILENVKSVISLGLNYNSGHQHKIKNGEGKVSRYAWGKDYHLIIWQMLDELEGKLKEIDPAFESKSYVDTGPVMDKVWAEKAGIGWIGKHTNLINHKKGSWFFIANIFTNYEFKYSEPVEDLCGSCTACLDACPTKAIVDEYVVDSNKCISYLTIENKNEIPEEFKEQFDDWIFGCDICQDVCPWNIKFTELTKVEDFHPLNKDLSLDDVMKMDSKQFKECFTKSPIKRAKLKGLKRNADFLMKNTENPV